MNCFDSDVEAVAALLRRFLGLEEGSEKERFEGGERRGRRGIRGVRDCATLTTLPHAHTLYQSPPGG